MPAYGLHWPETTFGWTAIRRVSDALAEDIPARRRRGVVVRANAVSRIAGDTEVEEGSP